MLFYEKKLRTIFLSVKNKLQRGNYSFGLQGLISLMGPYYIAMYFTDSTNALMAGIAGLFTFIEHKNFGFKRRIALSLIVISFQIIFVVIISMFFREHILLAIPFNFLLFFSLNYYNYSDTPNTLKLFSIQYFYIISLTTPIPSWEDLYLKILYILLGISFSGLGILFLWPTKRHRKIEKNISLYLSLTNKILKYDTEKYKNISHKFKKKQSSRLSDIMDDLYSLKYGNIFSTTKGKYIFKISINAQILNYSIHTIKKSEELKKYKQDVCFLKISEKWTQKLTRIISLLEIAVLEDKNALQKLEKEYEELNKLTLPIQEFLKEKKSSVLKTSIVEITYLIKTLIKFSNHLIFFKHKTESINTRRFNILYVFDNFTNNILKSLSFTQPSFRFAFHMSLLLTLSLWIVGHFDVFEGFWIPMTVLIIIKPNNGGTKKQTYNRIIGTIIGLIFTFFVIVFLPENYTGFLIFLSSFMAISFIKTIYRMAVIFITISVVLLMSIDFDTQDIFLLRFGFTMITAIIVLITNSLIFPNWSKYEIRTKLIKTLKSDLRALKIIFNKANKEDIMKDEVRLSMLNSYQGRKEITQLYTQMKSEKKSQQLNYNLGKQFLVAHERFSENYSRFVYDILTKKTAVKLPYSIIKKSFISSIENIINNISKEKTIVKYNTKTLVELHALLVDAENRCRENKELSDEQFILISDLKKITKRLLELSKLSTDKNLIFID